MTENLKSKLKNKQMTIYLSDDLQEWLKAQASKMTRESGRFFSVSNVIGQIISDYKESHSGSQDTRK